MYILLICASLFYTNRRVSTLTANQQRLFEKVKFLDMVTNYAIADDLSEIREQLEYFKNTLNKAEHSMIKDPS